MLGKHKSLEKSYKNLISNLKTIPEIKKIILGKAENVKHSQRPGRLSFLNYTNSGIHYRLYTTNGVRDVYIICQKDYKKNLSSKISKYNN